MPVLDRALAWIACDLRELRPAGDHEIGIGEVLGTGSAAGRPARLLRRALHDDGTDLRIRHREAASAIASAPA